VGLLNSARPPDRPTARPPDRPTARIDRISWDDSIDNAIEPF
jgi:hypothetical protein